MFSRFKFSNINNALILTWGGEWSFVRPVGRRDIFPPISGNPLDKGTNFHGQRNSFHERSSCFFGTFVGFQLTESGLQLFHVYQLISFYCFFFSFLHVQFIGSLAAYAGLMQFSDFFDSFLRKKQIYVIRTKRDNVYEKIARNSIKVNLPPIPLGPEKDKKHITDLE